MATVPHVGRSDLVTFVQSKSLQKTLRYPIEFAMYRRSDGVGPPGLFPRPTIELCRI